jgi:hypothetical protein
MGEKGRYKKLEEQVVVQELAAALSGSSGYTLLADAFFVDRQNLRFEVLCGVFSALGIKNCGRYINQHPAVCAFIKAERADSSSAQKELEDFIEYRNEAAHKRVENVLGVDPISVTGRFLVAVGQALAEMVEQAVLYRRMELNHYKPVMTVSETQYGGLVAIGTPGAGVRIDVGDEFIVFSTRACYRTSVETLQLDGSPTQSTTADGSLEVGLRLGRRVSEGAELRRLDIPVEVAPQIQLYLEEATPSTADAADTDDSGVSEPPDVDPEDGADEASDV